MSHEDDQQNNKTKQDKRKSRTVSNDSIEEYIGEFKDVSKPGQRQILFNKQPERLLKDDQPKDFKRMTKIESSKIHVSKLPAEIKNQTQTYEQKIEKLVARDASSNAQIVQLNADLKGSLVNLSQQLDVLILRNTLKKKRVTTEEFKTNMTEKETGNTAEVLNKQEKEIKDLTKRMKDFDDIDYLQTLLHRAKDYEAELVKLKKLNKLKDVSNMREGRQVMNDYDYRLNNFNLRQAKEDYFGQKARTREVTAKIEDCQQRIDKISGQLKETTVKWNEAKDTAKKEDLFHEKTDLTAQHDELNGQIKNEEFRIIYPKKKLTVVRTDINLLEKKIKLAMKTLLDIEAQLSKTDIGVDKMIENEYIVGQGKIDFGSGDRDQREEEDREERKQRRG